jgi:hypothetical protein
LTLQIRRQNNGIVFSLRTLKLHQIDNYIRLSEAFADDICKEPVQVEPRKLKASHSMKRLDPPKDSPVNTSNVVKFPRNVSIAGKQMAALNDSPTALSASIGSKFCAHEETFKFKAVFRT